MSHSLPICKPHVVFTEPATSSFSVGPVVPIPTLPAAVIVILLLPLVYIFIGVALSVAIANHHVHPGKSLFGHIIRFTPQLGNSK